MYKRETVGYLHLQQIQQEHQDPLRQERDTYTYIHMGRAEGRGRIE